jgi:hypothetical protein
LIFQAQVNDLGELIAESRRVTVTMRSFEIPT